MGAGCSSLVVSGVALVWYRSTLPLIPAGEEDGVDRFLLESVVRALGLYNRIRMFAAFSPQTLTFDFAILHLQYTFD